MNRICFTLFLIGYQFEFIFTNESPDKHAADLSLPDLNGKTVSLSESERKSGVDRFLGKLVRPLQTQ